MKNRKYVVVDLETTGTKAKQQDRIIQFAAVIIENQQITQHYNFLINPQQPLSKTISELTGITNEQLINQPEFTYYVPQIQKILKDAIFVAHNVNFDFPFLQVEMQNASGQLLDNEAIDTVELAQILLPQAPSFKLSDLTSYLNITHLNPHQADSDAWVTAKLFLYLWQQLLALPQPTLRLLQKFTPSLIRETGDFVNRVIEQACSQPQTLPDHLIEVEGLVLKKPVNQQSSAVIDSKYPKNKIQKKQVFADQISLRDQQMRMMNFVYRKIEQQTTLALIDAPTGMGKTLGYLFPISYYLDQGKQVIIATSTKLLQQQLSQEAVPLLKKIRNHNYIATIISSPHNYLDLDNFYHVLRTQFGHRQTDILKMRLIVWLTETETGELSELNLTNYQNDLFKLITSNGHRHQGLFYKYDFWQRMQKRARISDLIITNQAFLINNLSNQLWTNASVLIVDEASELLTKSLQPQAHLQLRLLKDAVKKTSDILYQQRLTLRKFFNNNKILSWNYENLTNLETVFNTFKQRLEILEANLLNEYIKKKIPLNERQEVISLTLKPEQINNFTLKIINQLARTLQELLLQLSYLFKLYENTQDNSLFIIDQIIFQLKIEYNTIFNQELQLEEVLASLSVWQSNSGLILFMKDYSNWDSLSIATQIYDQSEIVEAMQTQFTTTIFLGAGLQYQNSFKNFYQQLGIDSNVPKKDHLILHRDYDIDKQVKVYLPQSAPNPRVNQNFDDYLAQAITCLTSSNSCKTLVLFNSKQTLKFVYDVLQTTNIKNQREILAQGISGSKERLKKRFYLNPTAILLATNSFGEGLNLTASALKLVIITRLPFEAPNNPLVHAKNNYWQQKGKNPFTIESLPTAVRRLKQQVGRLIRSPKDQGILVFLDQRIASTKYGPKMYHELCLPDFNNNLTLLEISQQISMLL